MWAVGARAVAQLLSVSFKKWPLRCLEWVEVTRCAKRHRSIPSFAWKAPSTSSTMPIRRPCIGRSGRLVLCRRDAVRPSKNAGGGRRGGDCQPRG